jgi:hypothetical protein
MAFCIAILKRHRAEKRAGKNGYGLLLLMLFVCPVILSLIAIAFAPSAATKSRKDLGYSS